MKKILLFAVAFISICAKAQQYPLIEGFDNYQGNTPIEAHGEFRSGMFVLPSHGINESNALVAEISDVIREDSVILPMVGPLTEYSGFSFSYRIMDLGTYPAHAAVIDSFDKIEIWGKPEGDVPFSLIDVISSDNHTPSVEFKKVGYSLSEAVGLIGQIMIKVIGNSSNNYYVDFDSIQIKDEIGDLIVRPTANNPTCHQGTDGSLSLYVEGGIPPYTYGWNNTLLSVSSQNNLPAGTYTVNVWDNSGKQATASITLTQPEPMALSSTTTDALCNGSDNGTINLSVQNATAPLTFLWSNNAQTEDLSDLTAGTYGVVVTDALNCSASAAFTIFEPSSISISETHTNISSPSAGDGSIEISASGGTGTFQYSLDNTNFAPNGVFNNLSAGTYTVRVKDSNNCLYDSDPIHISEELPLGIARSDAPSIAISVYPNPTSSYVTVRTTSSIKGEYYLINSMGSVVSKKEIPDTIFTIDVSRFGPDKYVLLLNTSEGSFSSKITVIK